MLENASLHTLFSESVLNQARSEKQSMVMPNGFFKKPDPLATQLGQYVAYGDLAKAEKILKDNPGLIKKLLTEKVTVMDYSGRKMKHKTAFQLALCAWDVKLNVSDDDAMGEMLTKYMIKEEVDRQYHELFPEGHHTFCEKQKPFDFSEIIQAITHSNKEDVQTALDLIQPNDTALWRGLEKFRKEFTALSKKETVWSPQHLLEAFKQYDEQYGQWASNNGIQQDLFWRQVIGFTQRFLPANIAMDFAQGLYARIDNQQNPLRSFNFQFGGGAVYPLSHHSLSGLGYEYAGSRWAGRPAAAQCLRAGVFRKLMSSKNINIGARIESEACRRVCDCLDR